MDSKVNIYTDLAIETAESLSADTSGIDGVSINQDSFDGATVTWVEIHNEAGVSSMGRPQGRYVTLESPAMKENDIDMHEDLIKILADNLAALYSLNDNDSVLIIGLGNRYVTPDSLGPGVISKILVTRHITQELPTALEHSVRPVCAVAPGVMGLTGIETAETVRGLCDRVNPNLVIAIDALAARKTDRINATIQMTDTGVNPGSGLGNCRLPLNRDTLGVPVIAIGVPTVVDAATLVNDTLDLMIGHMLDDVKKNGGEFYQMLSDLQEEEKYSLITQILSGYTGNMFVTPKEVDEVVKRLSGIIANALNISLHKGITKDDINRYMY